jgi:TolA-binding protein
MKTNWGTDTDMTHCLIGMVIAIALFAGVTPGWSQQLYLYAPKPVAAEEKFQKKDGVLVQEVPVKKGDTLYGISRKFSGHGTYYPQILLFNEIKDPNKIYPGNILKIPVSRVSVTNQASKPQVQNRISVVPSVGPASDGSTGDLKLVVAVKEKKQEMKPKAATPAATHAKSAKKPPPAVAESSEQKLFELAIKAYRQDDCRTALELFDRFLSDYPSSALAADASLYKAECYLKQSNQ